MTGGDRTRGNRVPGVQDGGSHYLFMKGREGGGIVFQSRSTSNVSTRLLEASPINEAFLANLAPSVLLPSPLFPHPSSLINNARINFAIRSPYRKRDPPCFTDKVTRRYPDGDTSTEFWIGQLALPCLRLCLLDSW